MKTKFPEIRSIVPFVPAANAVKLGSEIMLTRIRNWLAKARAIQSPTSSCPNCSHGSRFVNTPANGFSTCCGCGCVFKPGPAIVPPSQAEADQQPEPFVRQIERRY